jgi:Skp family chaperone for outer membrane proteins
MHINKRSSLIALTSITATVVALSAAFFSVTGISKLFAGAFLSVLVMASALELGKLVSISFLYQYWKDIPKLLRNYLTVAAVVLMLITSVGIYGFLTAAYQTTADKLGIMDQQAEVINLKKARFQDELNLSLQERDRLSNNIQELSRGLANNQQQYRDARTGQILTTTSSANRNALQQQLNQSSQERTRLATKVEALTDSISALDMQVLELNANNDLAAEVGPLRFVSNLTGWSMDKVVNIFALMIVFVFDPLAVSLVIAVNFLIRHKEEEPPTTESNPIIIPNPLPTVEQSEDTPTEPYEVYVEPTPEPPTQPVWQQVAHVDPQWYTRGDFDWSNESLWKGHKGAETYYNERIKPRLRHS